METLIVTGVITGLYCSAIGLWISIAKDWDNAAMISLAFAVIFLAIGTGLNV